MSEWVDSLDWVSAIYFDSYYYCQQSTIFDAS